MPKALLIPVQYRGHPYPHGIKPALIEVPGHFDQSPIHETRPYSLHTEYSAGARKWDSPALEGLNELVSSRHRDIAELWPSIRWAVEFAEFIRRLIGTGKPPDIIEIHPPFQSRCPGMEAFLERYGAFHERVRKIFPGTRVVLENRFGTRYPGRFLVSTCGDLLRLGSLLDGRSSSLALALDLPQVFSAECGGSPPSAADVRRILGALRPLAGLVATLHLWGRRKAAHSGTLDDLFGGNAGAKEAFLGGLHDLFSDGKPRYLVPEVNSKASDLDSIIEDLLGAGFVFVEGESPEITR